MKKKKKKKRKKKKKNANEREKQIAIESKRAKLKTTTRVKLGKTTGAFAVVKIQEKKEQKEEIKTYSSFTFEDWKRINQN